MRSIIATIVMVMLHTIHVYPRYSVVLGTPDKVIDHMIEQKTDGDEKEGINLQMLISVCIRSLLTVFHLEILCF